MISCKFNIFSDLLLSMKLKAVILFISVKLFRLSQKRDLHLAEIQFIFGWLLGPEPDNSSRGNKESDL